MPLRGEFSAGKGDAQLHAYVRELRSAQANAYLGHPAVNIEEIDETYSDLLDDAAFSEELVRLNGGFQPAASLRLLFRFAGRLRRETERLGADVNNEGSLASREKADICNALRTETSAVERQLLHQRIVSDASCRAPAFFQRRLCMDTLCETLRLGKGYAAVVASLIGVSSPWLRHCAQAILNGTQAFYFEERDYWWGAGGEPTQDADLTFLMFRAGPSPNEYADLSAAICYLFSQAYVGGCQVSQIKLDTLQRSGKTPRPFTAPVDPPAHVIVSSRPGGSTRDLSEILHEIGHGLAFAGISSDVTWESKLLWFDAVQEISAFLCAFLGQKSSFLDELIGTSNKAAQDIARYNRFLECYLVRKHACLALLSLAECDIRSDFGSRAASLLLEHTGVLIAPTIARTAIEDELMSCSYLLGWMTAAQLQSRLDLTFPSGWWRAPKAWYELAHFWASGGIDFDTAVSRIVPHDDAGGRNGWAMSYYRPLVSLFSLRDH
ncbi:hypothetical protein CLV41_12122 [Roseibium marinum]|uniref:Peptidase M3A/M3B catalytic domain-containing protein n=1 Tax=Roseibium marinum TaxID=281252 RepID=A0A2S3UJB7_9HYPH|nr:hypothetical protein CLV41_12122 [Roseibium marinum]